MSLICNLSCVVAICLLCIFGSSSAEAAGCSAHVAPPRTMEFFIEHTINARTRINHQAAREGLTRIFEDVFITNTGQRPASLADPAIIFSEIRHIDYEAKNNGPAFKGQMPNQFVVVDMRQTGSTEFGGLAALGRPARWMNSCLINSYMINSADHVVLTNGILPLTPSIRGYFLAYTIAHEFGWHVVGGRSLDDNSQPLHMGANDVRVLIESGYLDDGTFPPFRRQEVIRLQRQLGYIR